MEQLIVFFVKDLNFYSDYKIKITIVNEKCSIAWTPGPGAYAIIRYDSYPIAAWVDCSCRQIVAPFTNKNGFSANSKINTNNFTLEKNQFAVHVILN